MTDKPSAPACERNWQPIARYLVPALQHSQHLLEIGSGTGQHAAYITPLLPHLLWQCSDRPENHAAINAWRAEAAATMLAPIALDVCTVDWAAIGQHDAVFSANTLHIMAWSAVQRLFANLSQCLLPGAQVLVYGPFNYAGQYTSPSNAQFDRWLAQQNPDSAIRDFEEVSLLAQQTGLILQHDHAMPANNRLLHWRYQP